MRNKQSFLAIPYVVWMAIFVVAPVFIVMIYAFSTADGGFTLSNFQNMGTYSVVFFRSFKLAFLATLICLVISYPIGPQAEAKPPSPSSSPHRAVWPSSI